MGRRPAICNRITGFLPLYKNIVNYIISNTDKYMPNLYNPDKSIEVLDTVCSKKILDNYVNKSKDINIKMIDVDNLIKERVNIINIDDNKFNEVKCELEKKYNELINPYVAFWDECIIYTPNNEEEKVSKKNFYDGYKLWCIRNNHLNAAKVSAKKILD